MKALQTLALSAWCILSAGALAASFGDWLIGAIAGLLLMGVGLDVIFSED